jgi:hypothetical protein
MYLMAGQPKTLETNCQYSELPQKNITSNGYRCLTSKTTRNSIIGEELGLVSFKVRGLLTVPAFELERALLFALTHSPTGT